jgi:hypothetical protein
MQAFIAGKHQKSGKERFTITLDMAAEDAERWTKSSGGLGKLSNA